MVDERPIDGRRWGEWVGGGHERWEVVRRSWLIFQRNTTELMNLLNAPANDPVFALQLMNDDAEASPFWEELDQRLHNQLSSAVSLVAHTGRLLKYYEADFPAVVAEYRSRNDAIMGMDETAFLRHLRNYLLKYGVPPIIQTLHLRPAKGSTSGHLLKLSAEHLLKWDEWKVQARGYLESFGDRDGPVIGRDVVAYANAMSGLFTWLFQQRLGVMRENIPDRFRMDA